MSELAKALCKAQSSMENAKKDSKNPFHKSTYANLESVIAAIKQPLADNGLAYMQTYEDDGGPYVFLKTTLYHSSGESIASKVRLIMSKQDMQQLGSATSYARRYSLQAIVGISQTDDDGEFTMDRGQKGDDFKSFQSSSVVNHAKVDEPWRFGEQEMRTLKALMDKAGMNMEKVLSWCSKKWPTQTFLFVDELGEQQFDILVIKLKEEIDKLGQK